VYNPANGEWTTAANITTARSYFGATILNDKIYAIGGAIYNELGVGPTIAANEQYTPIGYGTPDPTPSPSPSPSPTASPSPEPQPEPEPFPTVPLLAVSAVAITVVAALLVYFKKRKH